MTAKTIELIDFEKVDTLLEGFNKTTGFVTAISDLKGNILSKSGWRQMCTDFHRINPETSKKCTISDTELAGKLAGGEKYHFYQCLNGLVDVAVPIVINGEHIANLFSGQFFFEEPDPLFFKKQAGKYGFNEKNYLEALGKVPVVSKEKVLVAMDFLLNMTQLVSETIFQKLEQSELNKALKESELRFKVLFEDAPDAMLLADPESSKVEEANNAACRLFKKQKHELIGMYQYELHPPQIIEYSKSSFKAQFEETTLTGKNEPVENKIICSDGTEISVEILGQSIQIDGKLLMLGTFRDITERKRSEEEVRLSNEKFQHIFNSFQDAFFRSDLLGNITLVSPSAPPIFGYSSIEEMIGMPAVNLYGDASDREYLYKELSLKGGIVNDFVCEGKRKDGSTFWLSMNVQLIFQNGKISCTEGVVRDITKRKQAEEKLKVLEQQSLAWLENSPVCTKIVDLDFNLQFMSIAGIKGLKIDDITPYYGKPYPFHFYPESFKTEMTGNMKKAKETGEVITQEAPLVDINGNEIWYHSTIVPAKDDNGRIEYLIIVSLDTTEYKKAEAAMRLSEKQSAFLAQTAFELVELTSIQEIYQYTVQKLFELFEGNSIVALVEYNNCENRWEMQQIEGIGKKATALSRLLGFDINNLQGDISTKYYEQITSGKVKELYFDLPGLFNNKLSVAMGKAVKKMFSIEKMYCIAFQQDNQVIGNITFTTIKKSEPINTKLIEAFIQQVSNFVRKQKVEEELRKSEEMILSSQSVAHICSYSTNLNVNELDKSVWVCSPEFYRIFGIDQTYPHTIAGWAGFIHPDHREELVAYHEYVIKNRISFSHEYKIIRINDGAERWVQGTGELVYDEQGKPVRMHGAIQDVTDRKQAEEALQKSEAIKNKMVSNIGDVIVIIDKDGINRYKSPNIEKWFGWRPEELVGNSTWDNVHPDDLEASQKFIQSLAGEPNASGITELRYRKKDGSYCPIEITVTNLLHDPNIQGFLGNYRDISERKKAEQELITAKEKAEESDRLKSAFLANMSHEIRTPMNGILGFSELLRDPDLDSEEKDNYIKILHLSGQRMLNTVNDIIEISKIESGMISLHLTEINVNRKLEEFLWFFAPEASAKGLILKIEKTLPETFSTIVTDQHKLDSILSNLIKNAIKYTDKGLIQIGCYAKENHLEFFVHDTGIGIPVDRREAIFDRFVQADIGDKRAFQGSGLGLSITKSYVEMVGGTIWVNSEEGKGSCFYFTIPCCIADKEKNVEIPGHQVSKIEIKPSWKVPEMKILIAEDDEVSEMFLTIEAKKIGKEIFKAGTGTMAVDICFSNPDIDLILMDIKMPEMDGYEATRQIRKFNKEVIIIAQTAYGLSGDREKAIEAGCNDYISKPINQEKLQALIQKYFY